MVDILKRLKIFEAGQKYGPQGLVDIIADQSLLPEAIDVCMSKFVHRKGATVYLGACVLSGMQG